MPSRRRSRSTLKPNHLSLSERSLEFAATIAGASNIPMNARNIKRSCIMPLAAYKD
jgi:hypothetical protein